MVKLKILLNAFMLVDFFVFIKCESEYYDGYDDLWVENPAPDAIKQAYGKIMKEFMVANADPCDDLIEYSCGTWQNVTKVQSVRDAIESRKDEYFGRALKHFLTNMRLTQSDYRFPFEIKRRKFEITDAEKLALKFYRSCINSDLVKQRTPELILRYVKNFDKNNWPIENFTPQGYKGFDWASMLADMRRIGIDALFSIDMAEKILLNVDPVMGDTKYKKFENRKTTIVYDQEKISEIVKYLVSNNQVIPRISDEIIEFDQLLFDVYNRTKQFNNEKVFNFFQLSRQYPQLRLTFFISHLFSSTNSVQSGVKVRNVKYFSELAKLLNATPERTIRRYLNFRLVHYLYEMNTELSAKDCAKRIKNFMPIPVDALYIRYHLTKQTIDDVTEILKYLEDAFLSYFQASDWIDKGSKRIFSAKVEDYTVNIGFKFDTDFLGKLRSQFVYSTLDEEKYFENLLQLFPQRFDDQFSSKSKSYPSLYNAVYAIGQNKIVIYSGILHPPIYHLHAPMWAKFANLGYIVGHEMGHSFDVGGFMYNTNHKPYAHLNLKTYLGHFKRSVCFARQYNKYGFEKEDKHVDGIYTLRENMSDNLGLTLAYNAYQQWLKDHPDKVTSELVEGLDFSLEQVFFLARAQNMCNRQESINVKDKHSPMRFRLLGKIANSKEFAQVFRCPEGSPMNPLKKCIF